MSLIRDADSHTPSVVLPSWVLCIIASGGTCPVHSRQGSQNNLEALPFGTLASVSSHLLLNNQPESLISFAMMQQQ